MIEFSYECDFDLKSETYYAHWVNRIVDVENGILDTINFIFCEDKYLLQLNEKHLNHDTYTDIITFDYSEGNRLRGDIFISIERVLENSNDFGTSFKNELLRVMAHGVLHMLGYNDKEKDEIKLMRLKEEKMIKLFHVEHP